MTTDMMALDQKCRREMRILARFISIYCKDLHKDKPKAAVSMKTCDVREIAGREVILCPGCTRLLIHAFTKRMHCPMDPKPMCKHCPSHCYAPDYRAQIREVMRHSGKKMILGGRLDYLIHLFF